MLATLYLRAKASSKPEFDLDDEYAQQAVDRLDYDFETLGVSKFDPKSVATRVNAFDRWARAALARHPECTVLHLGCGLDTRVYRLDPPPSVRWIDIDFPEVIALREEVFPQRENYRMIGSSVTAPDLLDQIPADRPVLVIAEGLTMYLSEHEGIALLRRIADHFPSGEVMFDCFSRFGVALSNRWNAVVTGAKATLEWSIDDERDLERRVPGLRLAETWTYSDAPEIKELSLPSRLFFRVMSRVRFLRNLGRLLRFEF